MLRPTTRHRPPLSYFSNFIKKSNAFLYFIYFFSSYTYANLFILSSCPNFYTSKNILSFQKLVSQSESSRALVTPFSTEKQLPQTTKECTQSRTARRSALVARYAQVDSGVKVGKGGQWATPGCRRGCHRRRTHARACSCIKAAFTLKPLVQRQFQILSE